MLLKIKHIFLKDPSDLKSIIEASKGQANFFQLIDADKLLSEVQIMAAADHVKRNSNSSKIKNPENLLLMYVAGTTQISRAISMLGLSESTERIIAVYESEEDMEGMMSAFPSLEEASTRLIPYDVPEMDGEVFSKISHVEFSL